MNKRLVGSQYEELAADYLIKQGFRILERNYHNKLGEIDIIAMDGDTLVAIEVKYRKDERYGTPKEAVNIQKQRKISRAFIMYYSSHGFLDDMSCRFDVISILGDGKIEHIKNAFEFVY